jgi:hypothetical protein
MQYRYGDWERKRQLEKTIEARHNFIFGLIMAPCLLFCPFLIVYLVSLVTK